MSRLLFPILMFCATACVEEVGLFNGEEGRRLIVIFAWNTGADGYRLTSTRHDEQAARDARQMLAFDDYVEE